MAPPQRTQADDATDGPDRSGGDSTGQVDGASVSDRAAETDTGGPRSGANSAEYRTATARDGRTVAYAAYGDPAGAPVVFLHGTPGSRLLGALYDDAARDSGVRLLAPDRPGYGRSDPWPDRRLADTDEFLVPVLDDAGVDRASVVGFSGGGPHALAFAATQPERVRSVALVASAAPPDCIADKPRPQRLLEAMATRTPRLLGGLLRAMGWVAGRGSAGVVLAQYTDDPDAVPEEAADLVRRDFREALARSREGAVTESRLLGREWGLSLEDVDCPVEVWHGERDGNVPVAAARRFADRLPTADLHVLEGADHLQSLLRSRESVLAGVTSE